MKLKGLLVLMLALALVFAFSACGEQGEQSEPDTPPVGEEPGEATGDLSGHKLAIFCGAGMTKPFGEIAAAFQEQTGCDIEVTYANAAQIQTQINTAQEGDMFVAGSVEELKPVEEAVTEYKDLVKHIPVLAVQAGNPKHITGLMDLTANGVELLIGDPAATPIGKIAQKALTDMGIWEQVNIAATTATAPAMATALSAGEADAAIVWKENSKADGVEIVDTGDLDAQVKTVPAAVLKYAADTQALEEFYAFLDTDAVMEIWASYGYEAVD